MSGCGQAEYQNKTDLVFQVPQILHTARVDCLPDGHFFANLLRQQSWRDFADARESSLLTTFWSKST